MTEHDQDRVRPEDETDYAEGQKSDETVEVPRRFSEGQEEEPHPPAQEHGGDFAKGQETEPPTEHEGSFAEGQREQDDDSPSSGTD